VYVGPVRSALIEKLDACVLALAGQQLRVHSAKGMVECINVSNELSCGFITHMICQQLFVSSSCHSALHVDSYVSLHSHCLFPGFVSGFL